MINRAPSRPISSIGSASSPASPISVSSSWRNRSLGVTLVPSGRTSCVVVTDKAEATPRSSFPRLLGRHRMGDLGRECLVFPPAAGSPPVVRTIGAKAIVRCGPWGRWIGATAWSSPRRWRAAKQRERIKEIIRIGGRTLVAGPTREPPNPGLGIAPNNAFVLSSFLTKPATASARTTCGCDRGPGSSSDQGMVPRPASAGVRVGYPLGQRGPFSVAGVEAPG